MKPRTLILTATALVLAGTAAWAWRAIRHAHLDLVSLRLDNVPIKEAIRRIERQTRERVVRDSRCEGNVSLNLDAAPLSEALERLAEQVGGLPRITYVVHRGPTSLQRLAHSLANGVAPESDGWTNLSAHTASPSPGTWSGIPPTPDLSPDEQAARERGEPITRSLEPQPAENTDGRTTFHLELDEHTADPPNHDPAPPGRRPGQRRLVVRALGGVPGPDGTFSVIDLSPERLLLEQSLLPSLGRLPSTVVPATDAPELARRAGARCTRWFTLDSSPIPGLRPLRLPDSHQPSTDQPTPLRPEDDMRRRAYDRLTRLSPEQRARPSARHSP